jgi:hypothetical protein
MELLLSNEYKVSSQGNHVRCLALTMYAKQRVVVRRVVAMSQCRSAQIE